MSLLDGMRHRLYVLRRGEAYSHEIERELQFHRELAQLAERRGWRAEMDSEIRARRTFGNATYYREEVRAMTSLRWLDRIRQDVRYSSRGLLRSPVFTSTVVATLGLGIGVNAAMYSFLERMFIRPPAAAVDADGVRRLYIQSAAVAAGGGPAVFGLFRYSRFAALDERFGDTVLVAAYSPSGGTLIRLGESLDSVRQSFVSPHYFNVLRLRPTIGRFFAPEESHISEPSAVAVISDDLWRRSFRADPAVLGRVIELKTRRFTVVGVAPRTFTGVEANRVDVWLPINAWPSAANNNRPWYEGIGNFFRVIARTDDAALLSKLTAAGSAALRNNPRDARRDSTMTLVTGPLTEAGGPTQLDPAVSVSARIGAVAFIVLLIACANVANMLVMRASSRRREIAVRRALGVSTPRLYAQLITESVLLGVLSGAVALLFATWAGTALRQLLLPNIHWAEPAVDGRVALITAAAAFMVGFVIGLFPAAMSASVDFAGALKLGSKQSGGRRGRSVQTTLLVSQAALSVVLLVGAGLFARSFSNVRSVDLGYDPDGLLAVNTYVRDDTRARAIAASLEQIGQRLRARPGVVAVGLSAATPMTGFSVSKLFVPGRDSAFRLPDGFPTTAYVSPGFFAASGVRIIAGHDFTPADREGGAPVIILDEQLAHALWPGESPIGRCLREGSATAACSTVVGVVENVHQSKIIESPVAQYYLPYSQYSTVFPAGIVVRTESGAASATLVAMRNEMRAVMPDPSEWAVRTLGQILDPELRPWRMGAILFAGLGVLALIVATIGIYGVVAYAMSQRRHEMGVRIALGAQVRDILGLVLASGLRVVAIGVAIGLAAALMLGRLVASQLYGVLPNDPSILAVAAVTMCALAAIASLIPGWRASRVDPVSSLRSE
ncbi:MAG TPA: ABC transporter permease [Gemmatimonadaceae bacterium]|jgi:predicted permease